MTPELQGIGMTSRRTRARMIQRLREAGINDDQVLAIMAEVPRHIFLDEALSHRAYEDTSLPIGHSQTLSQPYIVAKMTEVLMRHKPRSVLELGTGSGYQTAILAKLVGEVFSVERIKALQDRARDRLRTLGLRNVRLRHADGGIGWADQGPFDAIMVTAAPRELPRDLMMQLGEGGVIIAPVGEHQQVLVQAVRRGNEFDVKEIEPVRFVPLLAGVVR